MRTTTRVTAAAVLCAAFVLRTHAPLLAAQAITEPSRGLALVETVALVIAGITILVAVLFCVLRSTGRRSAELKLAYDRQRAVIDAIPDALFRMDAKGRFLEFKPSLDFQPIVPPEEFLDKTIRDLDFPAGMVIHWEGALDAVRRDGGYRSFDYQLDYPDGPHDFEARIVQAGPGEYLAIVRDISARKRAEADDIAYRRQLERTVTRRTSDLIEANVRLQESNRAKSAFLANMSHELRTPLNSIIGFTDIMLKGLTGTLNDEQVRQLTMVRQSGKQLLSLVDDVLDHTRIESGRVTALPADFRLASVLGECLVQVRADAQLKGLDIDLDVDGAPAVIHSDRRLLEQVVLNLLSNAVKFTKTGSVTLYACAADDDQVVIEVRDTGIGIDPELRGHIFHAFEQGMEHTLAKPQGLGLGLAICHQLTLLLGGTIDMESEPGVGTTARLTLPTHLDVSQTRPVPES